MFHHFVTIAVQLIQFLPGSHPDDATANTQGECTNSHWDWIVRRWTMSLLARVAMWGLLFCFPVGANAVEADQRFEVGMGVICNSEAQVQRFLALQGADQPLDAVIQLVNDEEHDPTACSFAAIAFMRDQDVSVVPAPGGQMKITQITIVAAQTPFGWQRVPGLRQYTAIFEKLEET
jgi:hypothetical protein